MLWSGSGELSPLTPLHIAPVPSTPPTLSDMVWKLCHIQWFSGLIFWVFSFSINVCPLPLPGISFWAGPIHRVFRKHGRLGDSHIHWGSRTPPNQLHCCSWPFTTLTVTTAIANHSWQMRAKGSHEPDDLSPLTDVPGGAGLIQKLTYFISVKETLLGMRWHITQ